MKLSDVEIKEVFWGDQVLQLLSSGCVEDALGFISENGALLNSWQHGFCSRIFSTISAETGKEVLLKLATQCPVDEVVFDLVDIGNELDNPIFLDIVVPSYLTLLSRDANQKYLDWYLGMIKVRLKMMSSMTDLELKKLYIKICFDSIESAAKLFYPLTEKVRCLLVAELLGYYLMDNEKDMKNNAIRILDNLLPDPFFLLTYIKIGLNSGKAKYSPILDKSIVSMRAVCLYFGSRVLNCSFPLIYSPQYLLISTLPILHQFLGNSDELIDLGLKILFHFSENEICLTILNLTPEFTKSVSALNNVMIYNQEKDKRDIAFQMFNFLMSSLDHKGLYHMLLHYKKEVNHPSTISYLISKIKRSFMDPDNEYFKGKRLFDILKLYASIDKAINLLDEHVRIVTTLNFFWYLIGCHKKKSLHIDDYFFQFMEVYCKTVEELILKARQAQQESLSQLEKGDNCNLSVTMYDKSLPDLSTDQKINSIVSVRNAIDVVEHNLETLIKYWKQ